MRISSWRIRFECRNKMDCFLNMVFAKVFFMISEFKVDISGVLWKVKRGDRQKSKAEKFSNIWNGL